MPKSKKNTPAPDTLPTQTFPVVGIGASAGGLAAFEAFFAGMPQDSDPGMAFVLVQHLAPDHKSLLTELIRRYTRMQVFEVEDGMPVQINCAYIIPPNYDMALIGGTLQLLEPAAPRGLRLPIDYFFQTLAQDQHDGAIGVVLSGTGSDGTLGCRNIKGEGGLVLVQSLESCEFDGMPRSAIAAGLADQVLPPREMAQALIAYSQNKQINPLRPAAVAAPQLDSVLKNIYLLLRNQTGHDFSLYKPSTLERRIERRMGVNQITSIELYAKYLQQTPAEVQGLFNDLLIGVTNFFRDPEAFAVMEQSVIPKLLAEHIGNEPIRIWVAGCSSGEEAYSIAILLQEQMDAHKTSFPVALFATDIDPRAVAAARLGVYPAGIAADLSPQRLARFFTQKPGGQSYRIHKNIRDMLVFSEQDLAKDPPFSRLDLLCCRNLLIYFGAELQKKVLPLFHYALKPGGRLFLGSSEGLGEFESRFDVLDRKAKIYQRKANDIGLLHYPSLGRYVPTLAATTPNPSGTAGSKNADSGLTLKEGKKSLREITEQALLEALAPTGALVNARGDVLYLHGRTGLYLEPSPGEAGINNILKMAR
jgi:two-component system, chemotaxis family, CheB/CheR fusion protein